MTEREIEGLCWWIAIGLLYLLRNTNPLFKKMWYVVRMFFIVLLVTLFANFAKDRIKEWWKS
jgi:hypothetical protein